MCCRLIRDNLSPTPYAARNLLAEGRNTVRLVAKDLTGKTTVLEHQVFADWQGAHHRARRTGLRLRIAITDEGGIREVKVNGRASSCDGRQEDLLDYPPLPGAIGATLLTEATDRAGNLTRAELPRPGEAAGRHQPVLVASLTLSGLLAADRSASPPAGSPPLIEVKNWTEEQEIQLDQVYLERTVTSAERVAVLTVNGRPLLKDPSRYASFSCLAKLDEGPNTVIIEASDQLGRRRFDLVERQKLEAVLGELKLSRSEVVDATATLRLGKILTAHGLLLGAFWAQERSVEIDLRLVDVETSLVVAAVDVYGEEVDARKLKELCQGLVLKLCDELPVIEGAVLEVRGAAALTDLGQASKVKKGMRCLLFQEGEPIRHPLSGATVGTRTEPLAHGVIQSVVDQTSEVEMIEKDASSRVKPLHRVITQ